MVSVNVDWIVNNDDTAKLEKVISQLREVENTTTIVEPKGERNKQIGEWMENGTSRGIPPRPWATRSTVETDSKWTSRFTKGVTAILNGGDFDIEQLRSPMIADVKNIIGDGGYTGNAESTLKYKNGSTPLIDTGEFRDSIDWKKL